MGLLSRPILSSLCRLQHLVFCRYSSVSALHRTPLYEFHISKGAKMVEFAGYSMPLQYESMSIVDSHNHVREKCGLFDVSHMMQVRVCGGDRQKFMETLIVADLESLKDNQGCLSLYTNEMGGIMDDLIITRCQEPHYYIVSNAGCASKIRPHLEKWAEHFQSRGEDIRLEYVSHALLAVQGPKMAEVLQPGLSFPLEKLPFMQGVYTTVFKIPDCRVTRCGYTGEDGVEISVPKKRAPELADLLCSNPLVSPVGLAARDTLRLEAGLCLYGNDIDEETTPVEATLLWTVGKNRREKAKTKFLGHDKVMDQILKKSPVGKKRVGFMSDKAPPPRNGSKILSTSEEVIGTITSGCISPFLKLNVAMGYVPPQYAKAGTSVKYEVRNKIYNAQVAKMPFVPSNYYIPTTK